MDKRSPYPVRGERAAMGIDAYSTIAARGRRKRRHGNRRVFTVPWRTTKVDQEGKRAQRQGAAQGRGNYGTARRVTQLHGTGAPTQRAERPARPRRWKRAAKRRPGSKPRPGRGGQRGNRPVFHLTVKACALGAQLPGNYGTATARDAIARRLGHRRRARARKLVHAGTYKLTASLTGVCL